MGQGRVATQLPNTMVRAERSLSPHSSTCTWVGTPAVVGMYFVGVAGTRALQVPHGGTRHCRLQ